MNDMDQYEQEQADIERAKIKQEDARYNALPQAEKNRINEERALYIEQFEQSALDDDAE